MKIKSAKSFRLWYRTEEKQIEENNLNYNQDFVGTYHEEDGKKIKGFFEMYHGDKPDIAGYLPSILKIAEDGQAIYEFLQNAVDCGSTHFYIFYSEKYFLVINNGAPFEADGLKSILNIAQTTKKDADKIGRFGIGFKLAHRLVGKNEGAEELTQQYKGPVLFSWSKSADLRSLLNKEDIEPISPGEENPDYASSPYLLKLILTNFPTEPKEEVKDLQYKDRVLFPQEELDELSDFLKESFDSHEGSLQMDSLNQGSLFFIKLGEGKKEVLDRDYNDLVNGIQYSMNMLKKLQEVYINNEHINKFTLCLDEEKISKESEAFQRISPEYKDFDIRFCVGYPKVDFQNGNTFNAFKDIKKAPNFYKYFPMGDENNGFGFILHCDSFSGESNRRKLQNDKVNKHLFPELAEFIVNKLDKHKNSSCDRDKFLNLYVALLLSDIPDKQNNSWLKEVFYDRILAFLKTNIPTKNGYSDSSQNVKINKLKIDLNLSDFGLEHIQWFEWDRETEQLLIDEAEKDEKLGVKSWKITDIIDNANTEKLNQWIKNCNKETYNNFLKELNNSYLRDKTKEKICQIKLFKFSDGEFYAFNEIITKEGTDGKSAFKFEHIFINNDKIKGITNELNKLGFVISECSNSAYPTIFSSIPLPADKRMYDRIAERCKSNTLSYQEKKKMFLNFIGSETKFTDIGDGTLARLELFENNNGNIKPLDELINCTLNLPEWLRSYIIKREEYFEELKTYLISEEKIYQKVILKNWDNIISEIADIPEFYEKVTGYYELDEHNAPLKEQAFIYTDEKVFLPKSEIFFNSKMLEIKGYVDFQNAVRKTFNRTTPDQRVLSYLSKDPFKVDSSGVFDKGSVNDHTELDINEIKTILAFCKNNNEHFFGNCIIEKKDTGFYVSGKSENVYQVRPSSKEVREFCEQNLANNLKILPYELDDDCKDEPGIIKGEELEMRILEKVDIEDCKERLIDIIYNKKSKSNFLLKLEEIQFVEDQIYKAEDFEYKVLTMACDSLCEDDYKEFRKKVVIKRECGDELLLSDVQPSIDKIKIEGVEFSLSEILPETYQNSKVLSRVINNFTDLKLDEGKLNSLFGVNEELQHNEIYDHLCKGYPILQNAQQLAFLLLYGRDDYHIDLRNFKVETYGGLEALGRENNNHRFYCEPFVFMDECHILKEKYKKISEFVTLPFIKKISSNTGLYLINKEPYFGDYYFIIDVKPNLLDEEKVELIAFIYNQWKEHDKKDVIKKIDWRWIGEVKTEELLGFELTNSVFPSEYACESEKLPDYLIEWIGTDESKVDFISDLGVWTKDSPIVDLRRFWKNNESFNSNLERETRFDKNSTILFNSFVWLKENKYQLVTTEQYDIFKKVVEVFNKGCRTYKDCLKIQDKFNFEMLKEKSEEWNEPYYKTWKEKLENKFTIYLYEGSLPKIVTLDKIDDYIFYCYNQDDIVMGEDNHIFCNQNTDIKITLGNLVAKDDNDFTAEHLIDIYSTQASVQQAKDEKIEELEQKIELYLQRIAELEGVSGVASYNPTVSFDTSYHKEIKEKSEQYVYDLLRSKGVKMEWLNYNETNHCFKESWANHDFEILDSNGNIEHYIDCKGTPERKKTFYLTSNEWDFFLDCIKKGVSYQIYRVFDVESSSPNYIVIDLWKWIQEGKVVPYLLNTEEIKGGRVFLTLMD